MKRMILTAAMTASFIFGNGLGEQHALAETTECTEITSLPFTITTRGIYCLKQSLGTNITTGNAITVDANNVTIDFNNHILGGRSAGPSSNAVGVYSVNRRNITVRNATIRGFARGIYLEETIDGTSSGHVVEDNVTDQSYLIGIEVAGQGVEVRRNKVVRTEPGRFQAAIGIYLSDVEDGVVEDNIISGVDASQNAAGIFIFSSGTVHILNNSIFDIGGSATGDVAGIRTQSGDSIVRGNLVHSINNNDGDIGISGDVCIDNVVRGEFTNDINCAFEADNVEQ